MHNKLLHLFPDYKAGDWILQDNGQGPFIRVWNRREPKPAQETIDSVSEEQETKAMKKDKARIDQITLALLKVLAVRLNIPFGQLRAELLEELEK